MAASTWFSIVLNILEDIPHWCPIIKDHVKDVLVGRVLKGSVIAVFNPLAAQRHVLHRSGNGEDDLKGKQCWKE